MCDRELATIRTINGIFDIPDKDRIVQYRVDGWLVIGRKGEYSVGDKVIYLEPDSWVPHELAPFLSKGKEPKEFEGIKGSRLKTIRMGGVYSQGLLLPLTTLYDASEPIVEGADVSEELNIVKWEPPAEQLAGNADQKGSFPYFIVKTDQNRVQNLERVIHKWFDEGDCVYEVSEKLEGQSYTAYFNENSFGICSRNFELKLDGDVKSTWVATAEKYRLEERLREYGKNIAIQGEQYGLGVQGNIYKCSDVKLAVFNVYDIEKQDYLLPPHAKEVVELLGLEYVPIIDDSMDISNMSIQDIIDMADGKSLLNEDVLREGLVFKSVSSKRSFKSISNLYLSKE